MKTISLKANLKQKTEFEQKKVNFTEKSKYLSNSASVQCITQIKLAFIIDLTTATEQTQFAIFI